MVTTFGLRRVRAVSLRLAIVAAVLNVLIPYWIVPGFGLVVITVARAITREKAARAAPPSALAAPLAT